MRDAEATKEAIIKTSAALFNKQGYKATSISDITKKLGMTKGAIYRHFKNKSELEAHALVYMCQSIEIGLAGQVVQAKNVKDKMEAIFSFFENYANNLFYESGCPLLNAAVEVDDTNPQLKKVTNKIILNIHGSIVRVLKNGVKHGQLKKSIDTTAFSSMIFTSVEGAIMMTKITDDPSHMIHVIKNLRKQFKEMLV